jgi:demethoxyubiquinone hydroxylase (CLK1/Coq7/Cat5 family)
MIARVQAERARRDLVRLLQLAHAGEMAAAFAYRGHWRSVSDPREQERIRAIEADEWHHRTLVAEMLAQLGAGAIERKNIVEYEDAVALARACGRVEFLECLGRMAEVEREHERYFRERLAGHPLTRFVPLWKSPPARDPAGEPRR